MNGSMDVDNLPKKLIVILVRIVMPILAIILLLVVSPSLNRKIYESQSSDLAFRVILSLIFCIFYANMPFISKSFWYYTFPDFKKTNIVIFPNSLLFSIIIILGRFFVFGGITFFTLNTFLPTNKSIEVVVSCINGLIFALPALAQYLYLYKRKTNSFT